MSSFSLGIVTTNYGLGPKFFSIVSFHDRFHPHKERLFCNETLKSALPLYRTGSHDVLKTFLIFVSK